MSDKGRVPALKPVPVSVDWAALGGDKTLYVTFSVENGITQVKDISDKPPHPSDLIDRRMRE